MTRTTHAPESRGQATAAGTDTVTVEVTFRGLPPGDVATVSITIGARVLAQAAFMPDADGTATRTLAADRVDPTATVTVHAVAGRWTCAGAISPQVQPDLACRQT